jgi:hypothetical protein
MLRGVSWYIVIVVSVPSSRVNLRGITFQKNEYLNYDAAEA